MSETESHQAQPSRWKFLAKVLGVGALGALLAGPSLWLARHVAFNKAEAGSAITMQTTLLTIRGQIELYKARHAGHPPPADKFWPAMTQVTHIGDITADGTPATYNSSPCLYSPVINFINGQTAVGTTPSPKVGWVYVVYDDMYILHAVDKTGERVLTEMEEKAAYYNR